MIHGIYNYDGKVLWTNIRVENDTLVTGYRITNGWARTNYTYFAMSFSKPVVHYGCEEKAKVNYRGGYGKFNMKENFPDIGGRKIVAYFDFDPAVSEELEVKVALSGVSTDGALKICGLKPPAIVSTGWRLVPVKPGIRNCPLSKPMVRTTSWRCCTPLCITP